MNAVFFFFILLLMSNRIVFAMRVGAGIAMSDSGFKPVAAYCAFCRGSSSRYYEAHME